jgi:hypothetical protein
MKKKPILVQILGAAALMCCAGGLIKNLREKAEKSYDARFREDYKDFLEPADDREPWDIPMDMFLDRPSFCEPG